MYSQISRQQQLSQTGGYGYMYVCDRTYKISQQQQLSQTGDYGYTMYVCDRTYELSQQQQPSQTGYVCDRVNEASIFCVIFFNPGTCVFCVCVI
jgi:hypothetical protein